MVSTLIKPVLEQLLPALGQGRLPAGRQHKGELLPVCIPLMEPAETQKLDSYSPTTLKQGEHWGSQALDPCAPCICCQRSLGGKISDMEKCPAVNYAVHRIQKSGKLCSRQFLWGRASPWENWLTKSHCALKNGPEMWPFFGWDKSSFQKYSLQLVLKDPGAER